MRKVLVVKSRPVFVIGEIPQLPDSFIPLIRCYVVIEKMERSNRQKSKKEQFGQHDLTPRTIPDVKMPFWYRLKSAIREWYYTERLPRKNVGRWVA